MIVVFLGAPGSGKGTQAARLSARAGFPQISTGDILRRSVSQGTELGRKARAIMESGGLVPDDIMIGLIRERISDPDCRGGFLLDGFPRTTAQAEALDQILAERGMRVDAAVNLDVEEKQVVERMAGRARLEGRADDNPDTVHERLRVYRERTAPVVAWYGREGVLRNVNGMGSVEEVSSRIDHSLSSEGA